MNYDIKKYKLARQEFILSTKTPSNCHECPIRCLLANRNQSDCHTLWNKIWEWTFKKRKEVDE